MIACPDDNTLSEFLAGALDAETLARVEGHIDGCEYCRGLLVELAQDTDFADADEDAAVHPAAHQIAWDSVLQSRYVPVRVLGAGGMSIVYEGHDRLLDRRVALKVMLHAPEDVRARLRREARALAMLSHPNVVDVYDADSSEGNALLACELVDGGSLRQWVHEAPRTTEEILSVIMDAARGLEAAHRIGLVHRDVTPNNILVGSDGRGRVSDFGLARLPVFSETSPDTSLEQDASSASRTHSAGRRTGTVGTPGYIAPEVQRGQEAQPASDQYGLCVTAYEALHGRLPGQDASSHASPRSVPAAIDRVLARGMGHAPAERFVSLVALRRALEDAMRPRWRKRQTMAVSSVVGLGLLAASWPGSRAACEGTGGAVPAVLSVDTRALDERVAADVDAYATHWTEVRQRTCDAAEQHQFPTRALDRRWACLGDRHDDLVVTVERLVAQPVGAEPIAAQLTALEGLHSPRTCEDDQRLERSAPLPPVAIAAEVDRLEMILRRSRGQLMIDDEGIVAIDEVIDASARLGYEPLTARAMMMRGQFERERGEIERARDSLEAAAHLATAAHADTTAAFASLDIVAIEGYGNQNFAEAMRFLPLADAAIARLGDPADLLATRAGMLALVYDSSGDYEAAEQLHRDGLRWTEEARGRQTVSYADALANFGAHYNRRGNADLARQRTEEALDVVRARLGPDTLREAMLLRNLATNASGQSRPEQAVTLAERALTIARERLGPDDPNFGPFLTAAGQANVLAGRHDEGIAQLERAVAIDDAHLPAAHPLVLDARRLLADAYIQAERPQEADLVFGVALADPEPLSPYYRGLLMAERGILWLGMERYDEAGTLCERARVIAEAIPAPEIVQPAQQCHDDAVRLGSAASDPSGTVAH